MKSVITINGTQYAYGPVHYAYYRHNTHWRESASITNAQLKQLVNKKKVPDSQ